MTETSTEENQTASDVEQNLAQLLRGAMEVGVFMEQFLAGQLFMPVKDPEPSTDQAQQPAIAGFMRDSDRAIPLVLSNPGEEPEERFETLILFTRPDISKTFLQDFPEYTGGFIAEVPWILERLADGMGISINPGEEIGIDFDPQTMRQLVTLQQQN